MFTLCDKLTPNNNRESNNVVRSPFLYTITNTHESNIYCFF